MLVLNLGNGFFEAARDGGFEAAEEIGNVEVIYTGPITPTAEGQIEIINSLIAQGVDAIAITANDPTAVVPILQQAMEAGIKVISWDSAVVPEGRQMHLNAADNAALGSIEVELASQAINGEGEIAILSATAQAANANLWIDEMKKDLARPDRQGLKLVSVVYGDDQTDKSTREAQGLLAAHPNLKAIISPTTVGIAAAAQVVEDEGRIGEVYVTGLGLPSEMRGYIESGAVKSFALFNPIDLGYATVYAAYRFVTGEATGKPGEEIDIGRLGTITLDDNLEAAVDDPYVFDASNVAQFSDIF